MKRDTITIAEAAFRKARHPMTVTDEGWLRRSWSDDLIKGAIRLVDTETSESRFAG